MKKIGIIGCGWLGLRLAEKWNSDFEIFTTTTNSEKLKTLRSKNFNPTIVSFPDDKMMTNIDQWKEIINLDAVIITIPFSHKRSSQEALYNRFQNLFSFIGDYEGQIFFMNSTGVYPDSLRGFSEKDLLSEQVPEESIIKKRYPQINILRLAGLMGDNRLLSNYNVSDVNARVNHIHYEDIASVIELMINQGLSSKLYNIVAPVHPTKAEVICSQKNLPLPDEFNQENRIISSQKIISELGFRFKYPDPNFFHLKSE
ncbi:Rossmann-fold NAD(P)-binding domain-containing protein [Chryseobacterium echinoideorum]|uniref:hypothetical protein n=1 Tax=Chryseobacterium echinoideorum TaxID=1549648 RepID=UPI001186584C|nr:hypothetical protein [Chryseobacterium echinoideorum]